MKNDVKKMTYEEYKKTLYELAKKEPDPEYAKEGLDFADSIDGIKEFYEEGTSIESAIYLLCF